MKSISVRCPAKINLTFDILNRRADGYHDIETLFQSISLEDEITFTAMEADEFSVEFTCSNPYARRSMPMDSSNLIARAANALFLHTGLSRNWKIEVDIQKTIPIAAGLAGGSSDAAGTLIALNDLFDTRLGVEELCKLGVSIGADIPFCVAGGTRIGRGIGEVLTEVKPAVSLIYCIVKPRKISVSTAQAYSSYHHYKGEIRKPNIANATRGLETGDIEMALSGLGNVFEPMIFAEHPQLAELKTKLLNFGAWDCHMSGSGPTLFAVVPSREMAHHLRRALLNDDELGFFYGTDEVFTEGQPPLDIRIAESCNHGPRALVKASRD